MPMIMTVGTILVIAVGRECRERQRRGEACAPSSVVACCSHDCCTGRHRHRCRARASPPQLLTTECVHLASARCACCVGGPATVCHSGALVHAGGGSQNRFEVRVAKTTTIRASPTSHMWRERSRKYFCSSGGWYDRVTTVLVCQ